MLLLVVFALAAVALALAAFAVTRSLLRAATVTACVLAVLLLAAFGAAWSGYRSATAALLGVSPTARVVVEPALVAAPLAPGEDGTERAWRLWLDGRLRIEPEPAFLAALRVIARAAPEASLRVLRELSPHGPSV